MSDATRNFIADSCVTLGFLAVIMGPLEPWQRAVSAVAFLGALIVAPKPWGRKR